MWHHSRIGAAMTLIAWVAVFALMVFLFKQWLDYEQFATSQITSSTASDGSIEVVLQANKHNHFVIQGKVNGKKVLFLLDTGATDVSIPQYIADGLKLEKGVALTAQTAAGQVTVYHTRLDEVSIGPISVYDVPASINPHTRSDTILLGMSFLKKLEFVYGRGKLILKQKVR